MRKTLFFALAAFAAFAAQAAELAVMPVSVSLNARQDRQSVTIQNQGADRVMLQVEAVAWTQQDGADHYAPTTDLVVNPPVFTVGPGQSQLVRVGLRQPAQGEREVAYRLIVRQVPLAGAALLPADVGQVRVLLQLRLPVYVAPAQPQRAQEWHAFKTGDGLVAVELRNTGTVHQVVHSLDFGDGGRTRGGSAVLAGQTRRWEFRPSDPQAEQVVLNAVTDAGPQRVPLTIGAR